MMMLALTQVIFSLATVVCQEWLDPKHCGQKLFKRSFLWEECFFSCPDFACDIQNSGFYLGNIWEHLFYCCAKQALIATTPWLPWGTRLASQGGVYMSDLCNCSQISAPAIEQSIFPVIKRVNMENHPMVDEYVLPSGNQTWQHVHPL